MTHLVKHILRTLSKFEEITRPPRRPFADTDEPLAQAEEEIESWEPHEFSKGCCTFHQPADFDDDPMVSDSFLRYNEGSQCRVHHPLYPDWLCTKPFGHEDQHGYAGCFWTESPLSDDELIAVRGLIQERYDPNFAGAAASLADGSLTAFADEPQEPSVREDKQQDSHSLGLACVSPAGPQPPMSEAEIADYMGRAERVESGYIIHDGPTSDGEAYDRLQDLAAATYSSATPTADDPAGVEHPPVPPAGIPATADTIAAILEVEFWCKRIEDADQIGRIAADALLKDFNITHK